MIASINPETISVALLAGGKSGEREISLASGDGAYNALVEAGFKVSRFDTAKKEDLVALIEGDFDVAFLALHGKYGEDGTVQGFLETIGLPYTGPGVWSSATAIDKSTTKVFYERNSVPTPCSYAITSEFELTPEQVAEKVGSHCVVKAATEGSALGVYICDGLEDIAHALHEVFEIDSRALIESFITGEEYTVAVIGTEEPQALPVIRIIPVNEFYDFESKYAEGGSQHLCPAPLSEELTKKAQEYALAAHKALKCSGVSRSDLILDADNQFWVLETNTIPGMTATSLLPDAARAAGISFPELCVKLIECALEK